MTIIGYGFARTAYLDNLPSTVQSPAAAAAIFDTVTRFMERGIRTLLAIGLLVWLIAWLGGPSRPAVAIRRQWNRAMGRAGAGIGGGEPGPVNRWAGANAMGPATFPTLRTDWVMSSWPRMSVTRPSPCLNAP